MRAKYPRCTMAKRAFSFQEKVLNYSLVLFKERQVGTHITEEKKIPFRFDSFFSLHSVQSLTYITIYVNDRQHL